MPYFCLHAGAAAERDVAAADDGVAADIGLGLDEDDRAPASRATIAAGSPVAPAPITTTSASRSQSTGFWHVAAPGTALPNIRVIILLPFPQDDMPEPPVAVDHEDRRSETRKTPDCRDPGHAQFGRPPAKPGR